MSHYRTFIRGFTGMGDSGTKIAILSGKGGTGKTLLSVNLAAVSGECTYVDCDVEEPNGHLYFAPDIVREENVTVKVPFPETDLCTGCRVCVDFCKFNALAFLKGKPHVFEQVCHSCGGCVLLCPIKAMKEKDKPVGKIQKGFSNDVMVLTGILNEGEASSIPIINRLLALGDSHNRYPIFIDSPPGSACIVMETIKDADFCVLVAEPTVFGVHNLNMVFELVRLFHKPFGVVLNKCATKEEERNLAHGFCVEKGIPILGRIPFDEELGRLNSDAKIVAIERERYHELFSSLLGSITQRVREAGHEKATYTKR